MHVGIYISCDSSTAESFISPLSESQIKFIADEHPVESDSVTSYLKF